MATLAGLHYSIETKSKVNWSTTQENALNSDFPFDLNEPTPEEFAYRTYLQFLWLPESIMPLHLLVPSLRRVEPSSSSSSSATHPLHGLLDDLLLTVATMTDKYRKELLNILINGEGAGEMEECMMWFALTHEKADAPEPWTDAAWRERWLDRLERREVQIQILLYFLKMSLPPPCVGDKAKGKRRRSPSAEVATEEYAEAFMDKLSMWQLLHAVQSMKGDKDDARDWMQVFCEDIVEPEFKPLIPIQCQLLRSKVFPHSPFSDTESNASTTRASSPPSDSQPPPKAPSRAPSKSKIPSPSTKPSKMQVRQLARERSRSLSVSLAQERGQSTSAPGKRRVVAREISMSRVFKPKPKPKRTASVSEKASSQSQAESQAQVRVKDVGMTLVEDTPVKPREPSKSSRAPAQPKSVPSSSSVQRGGLFGRRDSVVGVAGTDNDDAWQITSSPDIMLLASPSRPDDDDEEGIDMDLHPVTPSRPSRRKAGRR